MQFNLVNDQEQVAQFVRRGWVAGRAGLRGCPTDLGLGCWGQSPDP